MSQKTPKNPKFINLKSHVRRPQMKKKIKNSLQLALKNIMNDIIKNFKTQKLPENHQKPKFK